MAVRSAVTAMALVAAGMVAAGPPAGGQAAARQPAPAYRIVDLASGKTLSSAREELLATPVLPGSVIKIATLVAALESGVIRPGTRMACPRQVEIGGRRITCSHADLGRPLGPDEALAHSCNAYFASVAARLRRQALDGALGQLGLPPTPPSVALAAAAVGLDGARVPADRLLNAFVRATNGSVRLGDDTRRVLLDGLRGAAEYGSASAFREHGISALAKTGTAPMPGGGSEGLLVAVTPADRPSRAIVVMAPGSAGFHAARIAADLLAEPGAGRSAPEPAPRPAVRPSRSEAGLQSILVGVARDSGGYDVAAIPLEQYVARVVGAEAAPSSPIEARKALAIVARTFALRNRHRHQEDGFDLCDLTHCQVMGAWSKAGDQAAAATVGQVLGSEAEPADVYYTASCGGHSERPSAVWPGAVDPAWLPARPEPECRDVDRWQSDVRVGDLQRALAAAGRRGQMLRGLIVTARTGSGRVGRLRTDGFEPAEISGEDFRRAVGRTLGWQVLKSALFDVERTAAGYRFRGRGRGHGVGLCVLGSARMAAEGRTAVEILGRYFPGAAIGAVPAATPPPGQTRLEIDLPASEQRERQRVEGLGQAALREFSAKTGVAAPASLRLVFHATVDEYVRASGQPWWTAGATRGSRLDFIPLSALRGRGALESTIRHELAHAVTAERLAGRPIWVKEAVAMHLAGSPRFDDSMRTPPSPGSCPADADWRAVRSPDDQAALYRRAAACFDAQRRAGRRWDEVR